MSVVPGVAGHDPRGGGAVPRPPACRALFLDRDGTLIVHRPYLHDPEAVVLLPGTRDALAAALDDGVRLFLFTNQSGVGRGLFTLADVDAVHRRMIALIGLGETPFSAVCVAPERPDEPSRYRKPSPRFIAEMLVEHGIDPGEAWMLGDSPSDWEAGIAAGVHVAAIVGDTAGDLHRERREHLGVPAHATLLDWWRGTSEPRL